MRAVKSPSTRHELRARRHLRVRKKVAGTAERPRLAVFRSIKHIYAQLVDDDGRAPRAELSRRPRRRQRFPGANPDPAHGIRACARAALMQSKPLVRAPA